MAPNEIAISEILLWDLPTKEVTLAPGQATIVRDIHTTIQPGQNEITILGLDIAANPDSIRIEGSGAATITDIQTSTAPQQREFDDVYPSDAENEPLSDEDDVISEDEDGLNDTELQKIKGQMDGVAGKLARAKDEVNSSLAILDILNTYGKELHKAETADVKKLEDFLDVYSVRREAESDRHHQATAEVGSLEKKLAKIQKRFNWRKARYLQERRAATKAIRLKNEKRARAREQKKQQRLQKRQEQRHFWTTEVGKVVVSLDGQTYLTPVSSRRSSVTEKVVEDRTDPLDVVLRLSYIVPGPGWSSRYELAINSPSSSAKMIYRAEFRNSSTEVWRDTRLTLSTSQASFSGIGALIPKLDAWNIQLAAAGFKSPSWDRILNKPEPLVSVPAVPPSWSLFGQKPVVPGPSSAAARRRGTASAYTVQRAEMMEECCSPAEDDEVLPPAQTSALFGSSTSGFGSTSLRSASVSGAMPPQQLSESLFGAAPSQQSRGLFGRSASSQPQGHREGQAQSEQAQQSENVSNNAAPPSSAFSTSLLGGLSKVRQNNEKQSEEDDRQVKPSATVELEDDTDTQSVASSSLEHQNSVKQDYGMTTTYELPGRRTLAPSLVSRRHVLAELDLTNVTLTYMIVPKMREAAFLRARIKNTSALTLHPGQVGITVDGSFIGSASIETCGPNIFFTISLGIDPGIEVKYAKPVVKPLSSGRFFHKEDGAIFRRSCWVKNTKSVAVDLIVHDQIPVSDYEKLGVRLLQPEGLVKDDISPVKMDKRKCSGTVSLLKEGKVEWALRLEPREETRLVLEYEVRVPSGSEVGCS